VVELSDGSPTGGPHQPPTSAGPGGLLGFAGLTGTAVVLDTWPNANDPSDNFVGIAIGTDTTGYNAEGPIWVETTTDVPRLVGSPQQVDMTYTSGRLKVRIDGRQVLDQLAIWLGTRSAQ
jgi:hypothetical protein